MQGARTPPPSPPPEVTCGFLIQLVFCKKKTTGFIGVEVEQETSAPPPKKILDPPLLSTLEIDVTQLCSVIEIAPTSALES